MALRPGDEPPPASARRRGRPLALAALAHGHDQALTELKNYAASGDNPALKEFAAGMIPTVTEHLEKARTLTGKIGPHAQ